MNLFHINFSSLISMNLIICHFSVCANRFWLVDIWRFEVPSLIDLIRRVWCLRVVFRILRISFSHSQLMTHLTDQRLVLASISGIVLFFVVVLQIWTNVWNYLWIFHTCGTFQMITAPSALPETMNFPHGLKRHVTILAACATPAHTCIAVW